MSERRQVHVRDIEGRPRYNRLWDHGGNVIPFDSGHGFVERDWVDRNGYTVCDGWIPKDEWFALAKLRHASASDSPSPLTGGAT